MNDDDDNNYNNNNNNNINNNNNWEHVLKEFNSQSRLGFSHF